jgi:hypothetical protein
VAPIDLATLRQRLLAADESARAEQGHPSLMVMLWPEAGAPPDEPAGEADRFAVRAWLWQGPDDVLQLEPPVPFVDLDGEGLAFSLGADAAAADVEHLHTLAEMPAQLHQLLTECFVRLGTLNGLVVECFLPLSLLDHAVERWHLPAGIGKEESVGRQRPVVVRALERFDPYWLTTLLEPWEQKSARLAGLARTLAGHAVVFDWPEGGEPEDLEEMLSRPDVVFLALTGFAAGGPAGGAFPGGGTGETSEARLQTVLNAGMPVALWLGGTTPRRGASGGGAGDGPLALRHAVRQRLGALLEACELGELPVRLWQTRRSALGQEDQIECHLRLLWDDHRRLPYNPRAMQARGPYRP